MIGGYRLGVEVSARDTGSWLVVAIDYELPSRHRWLGVALGRSYARWCCERMLQDAQHAFAAATA